jgi:hypothetical protein
VALSLMPAVPPSGRLAVRTCWTSSLRCEQKWCASTWRLRLCAYTCCTGHTGHTSTPGSRHTRSAGTQQKDRNRGPWGNQETIDQRLRWAELGFILPGTGRTWSLLGQVARREGGPTSGSLAPPIATRSDRSTTRNRMPGCMQLWAPGAWLTPACTWRTSTKALSPDDKGGVPHTNAQRCWWMLLTGCSFCWMPCSRPAPLSSAAVPSPTGAPGTSARLEPAAEGCTEAMTAGEEGSRQERLATTRRNGTWCMRTKRQHIAQRCPS